MRKKLENTEWKRSWCGAGSSKSSKDISKDIEWMKSGKAFGPYNIPVERWKCLEEVALEEFQTDALTRSWRVRLCLTRGGEFSF